MVLKKIYDEGKRTQRVWFDSTMIAYTEMVEDEFENKGNLFVTFKNGSTYVYKDVSLEDYVLFIGGGTDASQGKTLNKVIKSKYEFEKGEQKNIQDLFDEMNKINEQEMSQDTDITNNIVLFGEDDYTEAELEFNYFSKINQALFLNKETKFIIGDGNGFDKKIQDYLIDVVGLDEEQIEVFCLGNDESYVHPKIVNKRSGFKDKEERDREMTFYAAKFIAFVRSVDEITETSKNILKRYILVSL